MCVLTACMPVYHAFAWCPWVPWDWSYSRLLAAYCVWVLGVLWKSGQCSNHCAISPALEKLMFNCPQLKPPGLYVH